MSNGALDNLIAATASDIGYYLEQRYEQCTGTPIERAFETALHSVVGCSSLAGAPQRVVKCSPDTPLAVIPFEEPIKKIGDIYYWTQFQFFADWRVDFVVGGMVRGVGRVYVVVECDGHDFHERTKEQAEKDRSRDRRLQDIGFRIYRFTGREIYRGARECASQVIVALARSQSANHNPDDREPRR